MFVAVIIVIRTCYIHETNKANTEDINTDLEANNRVYQPDIHIQRIFAVIVSDTCVLLAYFIYQWIDETFPCLSDYSCLILLALIVLAIVLYNCLVKILPPVRFKMLCKDVLTPSSYSVQAYIVH